MVEVLECMEDSLKSERLQAFFVSRAVSCEPGSPVNYPVLKKLYDTERRPFSPGYPADPAAAKHTFLAQKKQLT
jgi:hypothetical protein